MPELSFEKHILHPWRLRSPGSSSPRPDRGGWLSEGAADIYAELAVTSNFTFLRGASHPEEFVRTAAAMGHAAAAIADWHTVAGIVRAHVAAKETGIPLAAGTRVMLPTERSGGGASLLLFPTDRASYGSLCRLLTIGKRRAPKGECHLTVHDVLECAAGLLCVLVPPKLEHLDQEFLLVAEAVARAFADDDRFSVGACRDHGHDDRARLEQIGSLCDHLGAPMAAINEALYHDPCRKPLQDVLTCIRHGCTIQEAGLRLEPSAERCLKPAGEMQRLFADYPRATIRSADIALRSASGFNLDMLRYEYPDEVVPPGKTAMQHLTELVWRGAEERLAGDGAARHGREHNRGAEVRGGAGRGCAESQSPGLVSAAFTSSGRDCAGRSSNATTVAGAGHSEGRGQEGIEASRPPGAAREPSLDSLPSDVVAQILHELQLIDELHYAPYFLTVYDLVRFARSRGILCQGRGAAANSAVCYCLGITSVDPSRIDMLFERFISKERDEPPDIDIDFEHERREEVIQYIYGKYGRERAALTAEVITYRSRSAIREVGKALGLSLDCVDRLAKQLDWWEGIHESDEALPPERASDGGTGEERERRKWEKEDAHRAKETWMGEHPRREPQVAHWPLEVPSPASPSFFRSGGGASSLSGRLRELGLNPDDPTIRRAIALAGQILGFPRHLSQHVGGFVMTRGPLCESVPIENARMPDRTVIEWDKDDIEAVGMLKVDVLGLGMLTVIRKAMDLVNRATERRSKVAASLALHTIPPEDPVVYDMICKADTVGVFQIESRAQMSMLPRLRPRNFYDLVIEVAIVRPGPIVGDMVHPYLKRRNGEEKVEYPDEAVKAVLGKTLGVPLFQEQAMKLAMVAAGFTAGEADQLRRAIAAWKTKQKVIYTFGRKIIEGMTSRGYAREFAVRCFEQLKGFSEYGFPESHAASFALLVYASAWLKCHHPAEFAAALINSQPMGFYAPAQIVRDARDHGVEVRPIDANLSGWECRIEEGERAELRVSHLSPGRAVASSLRLGLRLVDGLAEAEARRIESVVAARGPFACITDLWRASGVKVSTLRRLAAADAFGSMGLDRQRALWEVRALKDEVLPLFDEASKARRHEGATANSGEEGSDASCSSAHVPVCLPSISPLRKVIHDYHSTGLSLRAHPVWFMREHLAAKGVSPCAELRLQAECPHGSRIAVAGIVLVRQRPGTASGVVFMTLEDETGIANLIIWPDVFRKFRRAARHSTIVIARGRVQRDGEVVHVLAGSIADAGEAMAEIGPMSRDFR